MARKPSKVTLRRLRETSLGDVRGQAFERGGSARRIGGMAWIVKSDLVDQLDPAVLVDHVTDWMLSHHRDAIRVGEKANGSGKQPARAIVRRAVGFIGVSGDPVRGYETGHMSDNLIRSKIMYRGPVRNAKGMLRGPTLSKSTRVKVSELGATTGGNVYGTSARSTIYMPGASREDLGRSAFLAQEAARGVEYMYTDGAVSSGIDEAVSQWLDYSVDGALREPNLGELRAKDAKHST